MTGAQAPDARGRRVRLPDLCLLLALLALAAVLRLPGIDARGAWDADQGHDMRVLAALVGEGRVPLLGPMTSVGTFHHGALYYYLLWPAAAISGSDPVAVTVEFALLGIGAVAATWWLGRLLGGPIAGVLAGLLLAVSPAGISESTFIWNPNPIPLFAALAFGGVIRAHRSGRARWWLLAAVGTMATMQLHWLGGVVAAPVVAAWLVELRARRRAGRASAPLVRAGAASLAILGAGYLPLLAHEIASGFSETRALVAYLGRGAPAGPGLAERLPIVAARSVTWPIAGLVTERVAASLLALAIVLVLMAAAHLLAGRDGPARDAADRDDPGSRDRWATAWLIGTVLWSIVALAIAAPSLATVVPELPTDHYHAFLDPLVLALVAAGATRLARTVSSAAARSMAPARLAGRGLAASLIVVLVAIAAGAWPPPVSPDGGWPLADAAAAVAVDRVDAVRGPGESASLVGLPAFKPDDALRFPLERRGLDLLPAVADPTLPGEVAVGVVTVVCDPLFDQATGLPCGGLAEDRWLAEAFGPGTMRLVERLRAGARRTVSIYAPSRLAEVGTGGG